MSKNDLAYPRSFDRSFRRNGPKDGSICTPKNKRKKTPGKATKAFSEVHADGMTYREASKSFGVSHDSVYQFIQKYKSSKISHYLI
jgi:DNA invertase Pin-like site-specific DNA recombinase